MGASVGQHLRQFNPFIDVPVSATSHNVATYTYNIIMAARSSSWMALKAQMLASALNVYFSDSASPDGNKLGAPAPIGGLSVNLNAVRTGKLHDSASIAFGGAGSLTVSEMLAYASSQCSTAGAGAVWYGQDPVDQGLAAEAFSAVNGGKLP